MQVVASLALSSTEHIEHAFLLSLPPVTVLVHLPIDEVLPLLVGGVNPIIQLVRVIYLVGSVGVVASAGVAASVGVTGN